MEDNLLTDQSTSSPTLGGLEYALIQLCMISEEIGIACAEDEHEAMSFCNEGIMRKMTRQSPDISAFIAMPYFIGMTNHTKNLLIKGRGRRERDYRIN